MEDMGLKSKVLKEIMDLMDQEDGNRLKKHPKLQAVSLEVEKKDPMEMGEKKDEGMEMSEEELSPEMIEKLLEMMNGQ